MCSPARFARPRIVPLQRHRIRRDLHSFPTRRSSDLLQPNKLFGAEATVDGTKLAIVLLKKGRTIASLDRKSTRLNSSHQITSYAVFCLKKNKRADGSRGELCPGKECR